MGWPHHRHLRHVPYSFRTVSGFLLRFMSEIEVRRDLLVLFLIREKTRKSNRLQMSLQKEHFLFPPELTRRRFHIKRTHQPAD